MADLITKKLKSGKSVGFVPMNSRIEMIAAKASGNSDKLSGQIQFVTECVKMTLREVDGSPVNYESLSDLDSMFTMREIRDLREAFSKINYEDEDSPL